MNSVIKVLFMGTPDFAVPVLRSLGDSSACEVVGVVTQPDRPTGRKQELTQPPVKRAARDMGLRVLQPEKVRTEAALSDIAALAPDVIVTAAYGQLLPQALLDIPRVGCLNVHASVLPRWRGAAPIHRAIMAGDVETGVTIMEMVLALDAGPIVGVARTAISLTDNVASVHDRLSASGAALLAEILPDYVAGKIQPTPQPETGITYAERILRSDERVDWGKPVNEVHNHIRGLSPWPGAVTTSNGNGLKLWASAVSEHAPTHSAAPGTTVLSDGTVWVRCLDGWLELREVQPAGKRKMAAADWMRGTKADEVHLFEGGSPA